jgi:ABC-type lipoprotein export system ATPase subunit
MGRSLVIRARQARLKGLALQQRRQRLFGLGRRCGKRGHRQRPGQHGEDGPHDGKEISTLSADELARVRSQKIGFVFQTFNLLPRTSALENVKMPLEYAVDPVVDEDARKIVGKLLDRVGLKERAAHVSSQMLGGQQERVAIERALVNRPLLLLADEPTGNLDSRTSADVLKMFQDLNEVGITILLLTHDAEVANHAQRT